MTKVDVASAKGETLPATPSALYSKSAALPASSQPQAPSAAAPPRPEAAPLAPSQDASEEPRFTRLSSLTSDALYQRVFDIDNNGISTASSCTGEVTDTQRCIKGRDISIGTQAALGAMLSLDWLEPSAGAELDNTMRINNTYIFFEWSVSNYPGKQMNVGSNSCYGLRLRDVGRRPRALEAATERGE